MWFLDPINDTLKSILAELKSLNARVSWLVLAKPGPLIIRQKKETDTMLVYDSDLKTPKPAPEVLLAQKTKTQRFIVTRKSDGQVFADFKLPIEADVTPDYRVPRDTEMFAQLSYFDQGENGSAPSVQEWFAKDTIPPDAPGPLGGFNLKADEPDE